MGTSFKFVFNFIFFLITFGTCAQDLVLGPVSPAVNSLMQFESNPVSLATGNPHISIPVYQVPTVSKDVTIDLSLYYHPASVAVYDSLGGNCGRGWSLSMGGVLASENGGHLANNGVQNHEGIHFFNFMGHTGKFKISKVGDSLIGVISENSGKMLYIDINHSPDLNINSIRIYDINGISYLFETIDSYPYVSYKFDSDHTPDIGNYFVIQHKAAYKLSKIYSRTALLAEFHYETYNHSESYTITNTSVRNEVSSISVPGYGTIEFEKTFDHDKHSIKYNSAILKNPQGNTIRRSSFVYEVGKLSRLDQGNDAMTEIQTHKFFYKANTPRPPGHISDMDSWGYANVFPETCFQRGDRSRTRYASPKHAMAGVLEKIVFPTGGCKIFKYELNSYSHLGSTQLDMKYDGLTKQYILQENYFTDFNLQNMHNFEVINTIANLGFSSPGQTVKTFTISGGPMSVLISASSAGYMAEYILGQPQRFYPGFNITKNGQVLNIPGQTGCYENSGIHPGYYLTLGNGTYTVTMDGGHATAGNIVVRHLQLKSNFIKEHLGGGIRIKTIGNFIDGNTPQNYYDHLQQIPPDSETNYDYRFFNTNRSSGSISQLEVIREWHPNYPLAANTPATRSEPVWYKNVTVTKSGNAGKTTYSFNSPVDYSANYYAVKSKIGKVEEMIIYSQTNDTLQKVNYDYNFTHIENFDSRIQSGSYYGIEWVVPGQTVEKNYFSGGTTTTRTTNLDYYNTRMIKTKQSVLGSEILSSKYFYHPIQNGDIERIENYRGTDLLSTSKINYLNNWPAVHEGDLLGFPNPTWLPHSFEVSKDNQPSVIKSRITKYDYWNNILESEQEKGLKTVFLWGYGHSQIIAKIENAAYADIPMALIDAARAASDSGSEATLLTALTAIRNAAVLANAMVTTYTYKPLIGISTVTDARGQKQSYEYDHSNRLKLVRDHKGKILSESEYHYKPQL